MAGIMSALEEQAKPLQIPSTLTDDAQLRRLDAWTREAIDERLKVLEDVQRSLWKAAEELQRVRSMIPPIPPLPHSQSSASSSNFASSSSAPSVDVKGKGRAAFDIQEEDLESGLGLGSVTTAGSSPIDLSEADILPQN
jgi:E3 ubiquitin-protein ligase synoviolin